MKDLIILDMDGTIADTYQVQDWMKKIRGEDVSPYVDAKPMIKPEKLKEYLQKKKEQGCRIAVISWGAKFSSGKFLNKTYQAKIDWLRKYDLVDVIDDIVVTPYGTNKKTTSIKYIGRFQNTTIYDDSLEVRTSFPAGEALCEKQLKMICER